MSSFPYIFTFYSFKGGVGRSMAVLNVAYDLAGRGRNVLILDMDLEAPGLSGFMNRQAGLERQAEFDVIDLVTWAKTFAKTR
ncbi:MAG TPA: P-loop NTPase, partial [Phycisphaerae bacterium]|nr:P-loop NTPase [Phycisphaerae bacterium]